MLNRIPNRESGILKIENTLCKTLRVKFSKIGSLMKYLSREITFLRVKSLLSIVLSFYAPISFKNTKKIMSKSIDKLTWIGNQDFLPCFITR